MLAKNPSYHSIAKKLHVTSSKKEKCHSPVTTTNITIPTYPDNDGTNCCTFLCYKFLTTMSLLSASIGLKELADDLFRFVTKDYYKLSHVANSDYGDAPRSLKQIYITLDTALSLKTN